MPKRKPPVVYTTRAELNKATYLKAPTYQQIYEYVRGDLKVTLMQFERFFGIPEGTMRQVGCQQNDTKLPAKYWHLIYEKIKPAYGVGIYKELPLGRKQRQKTETKKVNTVVNNSILDKLKEQLND